MPNLGNKQLEAVQCPRCAVDKPNLMLSSSAETTAHSGVNRRFWAIYQCISCGAWLSRRPPTGGGQVSEMYPSAIKETFDFSGIPKEVAEDFQEALICLGRSPHHDTI